MEKSIIKKLKFIHGRLETLAEELESMEVKVSVDIWTLVFMLWDLDEVRRRE